jgi:hypothetical protein
MSEVEESPTPTADEHVRESNADADVDYTIENSGDWELGGLSGIRAGGPPRRLDTCQACGHGPSLDDMATAIPDLGNDSPADGTLGSPSEEGDRIDLMAVASVLLSSAAFLTLLKLADRRDRTPARALGLFVATSLESVSGTALGLSAAGRARDAGRPSRNLLLATAGSVLGVLTTLLNINWMRTRRRI